MRQLKYIYQYVWKYRSRRQRLAIMLSTVLVSTFLFFYFWIFASLPSIDNLEQGVAVPSTRIYDRHGRLLYEIVDLYGGSHETLNLGEMASCIVDATIATEDANFYQHPGVDIEGILRALWLNVRGGEIQAGGSTITQQVARNLLLTKNPALNRSLRRKIQESILALQLTQQYSRDEILELYLNQTYYGNLAYGISAASRAYFGKDPSALSLAECAMLAGLPQAPGLYNPLINPELAKQRQAIVLDLMVKHGYISATEAEIAKNEPLDYQSAGFDIRAPHFVAAVWTQLERDFGDELLLGGLEVYTTIDLNWQEEAEFIANRHLEALNDTHDGRPPSNVHNAALVAIDPFTGEILAMLGSPDYFDESIDGNVNAALAPRQPGSTLKPFAYAAAFDPTMSSPWTPATMILDVKTPFVTRRLESYVPSNFGLVEHGPVLIREALASSYNIPAVVTMEHIGVEKFIALTSRLGITTFTDPSKYDLSLVLGGGEVRLLDLTAAYAAYANGGQRVEPVYIQRIVNAEGQTIYEWHPPDLGQPELDPRVAYLITSILSDPYARIPSFGVNSALDIGRIAAAKTGTTTDYRDNWTVGYTPDLVVGVWVGNADNTPMRDVSGISGAGPIWNDFMRAVLYGKPVLDFPIPEGLVRAQVCVTSGLLPTEYCPKRLWEWFIEGTVPTQEDTFYRPYEIDSRSGTLATDETPEEYRTTEVYLVLPPEARDWAAREGIPPPPDGVFSLHKEELAPVRLLAPDPYTIFQVSPLIPQIYQRVRWRVAVPTDTLSVQYRLNDEVMATIESAPFEWWWPLEVGTYQLVAEATLRDGEILKSEPITFQVQPYESFEQN
ncbi:MAG: penicillin-binding protein [Phototrophicales bacterium]|nr:MAG: penicillin-binding protein [Phototrophicales bacterium]